MSDTLTLAVDFLAFGLGSIALGCVGWQIDEYRRKAGTLPRRAARAWTWRIVLGLCATFGVAGYGFNDLLLHFGIGALNWLLIPGLVATFGVDIALIMIHHPESFGGSQRCAPDDDADDDSDDDVEG